MLGRTAHWIEFPSGNRAPFARMRGRHSEQGSQGIAADGNLVPVQPTH
jgi:hypothetical protein